jgi:alpha-beta hydrolase superfamily lysophospholipase
VVSQFDKNDFYFITLCVMKRLVLIFGLMSLTASLFAQGITGDWYGALNVQGTQLPIVFLIVKNADVYTTTWDSPKQGAKGLATDKTTVTGNQLTIDASKFGIIYSANFLPDSNKINGTFKQGANNFPLNLSHNNAPVIRPQDPKDFPYKQEDVAFDNAKGGDRLAGTLTMPSDGKASKIVVLITGSGPQNRNEELLDHRPFLVWSDWLTRHGIAVLRYDDRGIAKSTGSFATSTTADFADDAEAAVSYIQSRADLKNLSIGLMGHSEGGLIAPMVASRNKAVKFIVLLAGPGVPIVDLMTKQTEDQARVSGSSDALTSMSGERNNKLYNVIVRNPSLSTPQLKQVLDSAVYKAFRSENPAINNAALAEIAQAYATMLSPWYRYFIAANPTNYLTKVKCPVLALDGTKDMQVNAEANLAGIKASLEKGGNKHFEVVPMPDLNHLFQKAVTGSLAEYSQIQETVNPAALEKVTGWINQL